MSKDITFPYALDAAGVLRHAASADRGEFQCLDHGCKMVLHRGEVLRPHFAHLPGEGGGCSLESMEHKTAKLRLLEALDDDAHRPRIVVFCEECGSKREPRKSDFVPRGARGVMEFALGNRRIDVAAVLDDKPVMLIECQQFHAVDEEKSRELNALGIPWIEVSASNAIDDPRHLRPIAGSEPCTCVCDACVRRREEELVQARLEEARREAAEQINILRLEDQQRRIDEQLEEQRKRRKEEWLEIDRRQRERAAQEAIEDQQVKEHLCKERDRLKHERELAEPVTPAKIGRILRKTYWACVHCRCLTNSMSRCLRCGAVATIFLGLDDGALSEVDMRDGGSVSS